MPFSFPNLWPTGSVWGPKSDLNPVPPGQDDNYWAAAESNFLSSSLVSVSSSLSGTELAINTLSASLALGAEPAYGWSYTASYSATFLTSEVWRDAATGNRVRQTDYAYAGSQLSSEVVAVYAAADGTTLLARASSTFHYSGSLLSSASLARTA